MSAQNIDSRYTLELPQWGGSNEYPQSMFLNRNKKNNIYTCKPQFYYIKVFSWCIYCIGDNAPQHSIWSGSTLFAIHPAIFRQVSW